MRLSTVTIPAALCVTFTSAFLHRRHADKDVGTHHRVPRNLGSLDNRDNQHSYVTKSTVITTTYAAPTTIITNIEETGVFTLLPGVLTVTADIPTLYFYLETSTITSSVVTSYETDTIALTSSITSTKKPSMVTTTSRSSTSSRKSSSTISTLTSVTTTTTTLLRTPSSSNVNVKATTSMTTSTTTAKAPATSNKSSSKSSTTSLTPSSTKTTTSVLKSSATTTTKTTSKASKKVSTTTTAPAGRKTVPAKSPTGLYTNTASPAQFTNSATPVADSRCDGKPDGYTCGSAHSCIAGACAYYNNDNQCGAVNVACNTAGNYHCVSGTCKDTLYDANNCGAAYEQCGDSYTSGAALSCNQGICVDTTNDSDNCGKLGAICPAGSGCLNSACIDTTSDAENCSVVGYACPSSMPNCVDSVCQA